MKTSVVIETSRYRISGNVSILRRGRLSDYANSPSREFFAVTEASISPLDDPNRERPVGFLLVAHHEISLVMPGGDAPEDAMRTREHLMAWAD